MFLKNSGNFLNETDLKKTQYKRNKPKLLFIMLLISCFLGIGFLAECGTIVYYSFYLNNKTNPILTLKYNSAQTINNELLDASKHLAYVKTNGIQTLEVLNSISLSKPPTSNIKDLSITPEKITFTVTTTKVEDAAAYAAKLSLIGYEKTYVDNITQKNNMAEYIINATKASEGGTTKDAK